MTGRGAPPRPGTGPSQDDDSNDGARASPPINPTLGRSRELAQGGDVPPRDESGSTTQDHSDSNSASRSATETSGSITSRGSIAPATGLTMGDNENPPTGETAQGLPQRIRKTRRRDSSDEEHGGDDKRQRQQSLSSASTHPTSIQHSGNITEEPLEASYAGTSYVGIEPHTERSYASAAAALPPPASPSPSPPCRAPPTTSPIQPIKGYPPIMVQNLPNWTQHFQAIHRLLGRAPNGRPHGKGFRFVAQSTEEFRTLQKYLTELTAKDPSVSWHCYALEEELPTKVGIKGLPFGTPTDEIKKALELLGFTTNYIKEIPPRKGTGAPIYFASLNKLDREALSKLYATQELLYLPGIRIEAWKPRGGTVPQCHRCQGFGHASGGCHRPPKCVKCAGDHFSSQCTKPTDEPTKCTNCGGTHVACNRRCPSFLKEARKRGVKIAGAFPRTQRQVEGRLQPTAPQPTARPTAPASMGHQPVEEYATHGGPAPSLLPPVNPPTERGQSLPTRKRKRYRGKKKKRTGSVPPPLPSSHMQPTNLPAAASTPIPTMGPQTFIPVGAPLMDIRNIQRPPAAIRRPTPTRPQGPTQANQQQPVVRQSRPLAPWWRTQQPGTASEAIQRDPRRQQQHTERKSKSRERRQQSRGPQGPSNIITQPAGSGRTPPLTVILGVLTELLAAIAAGGDLRQAAMRGLSILATIQYE